MTVKVLIRGVLMALSLLVLGCQTTVIEHESFDHRKGEYRKIAVLPAQAEIVLLALAGRSQKLPEIEKEVVRRVNNSLAYSLSASGFQVDFFDDYQDDPDFKFLASQFYKTVNTAKQASRNARKTSSTSEEVLEDMDSFDKEYVMMPLRRQQKRSSTSSQGNHVESRIDLDLLPLREYTDADAVLLVESSGFKRSGANIAKLLFVSTVLAAATGTAVMGPFQWNVVQLTLVDLNDGVIVWANHAENSVAISPPTYKAVKPMLNPAINYDKAIAIDNGREDDGAYDTTATDFFDDEDI